MPPKPEAPRRTPVEQRTCECGKIAVYGWGPPTKPSMNWYCQTCVPHDFFAYARAGEPEKFEN